MMKKPKFHFKAKYIFLFLLFSYVIVCQSCMTMRMNPKETSGYFKTSNVAFLSQTETIGSHKIHYIQTGNPAAPTLFFVHGSPGSWDAFKSYLSDSLLLSKYRLIAVDRLGFGYSDFGNAEGLPEQAKILETLIEKIDNKQPITLIGHSLGGPVVVQMAAEKPAMFHRIFVLSGAIDPNAETPELWRAVLKAKPIRYLIPGALRTSNDELWLLKSDLYDLKPLLKNIRCSVTIIHGTKDPLVPFSNVAFMEKNFVNAKMIDILTIENANHFIPWEHFKLIRDALFKAD